MVIVHGSHGRTSCYKEKQLQVRSIVKKKILEALKAINDSVDSNFDQKQLCVVFYLGTSVLLQA